MTGALGTGTIREQVEALGGAGRGGGTRRLAEARAAVSGRPIRSEMRAVQRALKTGRPPVKQAPAVAAAGADAARKARADKIRNAARVQVGNVKVKYNRGGKRQGASEGTRDLGSVDGADIADTLDRAADAVENGDDGEALDILSEGLLDHYADMGGTLAVAEWTDGLSFD